MNTVYTDKLNPNNCIVEETLPSGYKTYHIYIQGEYIVSATSYSSAMDHFQKAQVSTAEYKAQRNSFKAML